MIFIANFVERLLHLAIFIIQEAHYEQETLLRYLCLSHSTSSTFHIARLLTMSQFNLSALQTCLIPLPGPWILPVP